MRSAPQLLSTVITAREPKSARRMKIVFKTALAFGIRGPHAVAGPFEYAVLESGDSIREFRLWYSDHLDITIVNERRHAGIQSCTE